MPAYKTRSNRHAKSGTQSVEPRRGTACRIDSRFIGDSEMDEVATIHEETLSDNSIAFNVRLYVADGATVSIGCIDQLHAEGLCMLLNDAAFVQLA